MTIGKGVAGGANITVPPSWGGGTIKQTVERDGNKIKSGTSLTDNDYANIGMIIVGGNIEVGVQLPFLKNVIPTSLSDLIGKDWGFKFAHDRGKSQVGIFKEVKFK